MDKRRPYIRLCVTITQYRLKRVNIGSRKLHRTIA